MYKYAQVAANKVVGVQSSTNPIVAVDLIEVTDFPELGDDYDGSNFTTPAPEAPTPIRKISVGAMRRRFTLAEKVLIAESTDTAVKVIERDLETNDYIDLDHADLVAGIDHIIAQNLVAPGRRSELLADGDGTSIGEMGEF